MTARIQVLEMLEATTGGTRRHLVDLATHLDPARFAASGLCATLRDPGFLEDVRAMQARGIPVTVIRMVRAINPVSDLAALARIVRHLRRQRYDIVHAHSSKAGFLGRVAARLCGVPAVIYTPHGFSFEMDVNPANRRLYLLLERLAARLTDRIICVCPSERATALRAQVGHADKCVVVENAVDAAQYDLQDVDATPLRRTFGFGDNDPVIGVIGRFSAQKGHRYLLEAFRGVVQSHPDARLLLVGQGELRQSLAQWITDFRLDRNCRMVEATGNMAQIHALCDLFVFPSLWEGLPYTLLEVMAAGKPVIATAVGGMPDAIVAGEDGLLVRPKDGTALHDAIMALLRDSALRARLGSAARRNMALRPQLADMVRQTEAVYAEALRRSQRTLGIER
jgi:glycosyltransferase involved in cell wall biosynthesis